MDIFTLGKVVELAETGEKPIKVQLLRKGKWFHPMAKNKELNVDDALLTELEDNFNAGIRGPELPMNMDHDDPMCKKSPSWINKVFQKDGNLYGIVEFSDKNVENDVRSKKIKYVSPEITFGWNNPEDGNKYNCLKAVAWTNMPYIKNMQPAMEVAMSEAIGDEIQNRDLVMSKVDEALEKFDAIEKEYADRVKELSGTNLWSIGFGTLKDQLRLVKEVGSDAIVTALVEYERRVDRNWEYLIQACGSPNTQQRTRDWPLIAEEFKEKLYGLSRDILEATYQDGPKLSEVDDFDKKSRNDEETDPEDQERNNSGQSPDEDSQVQHPKNDPDSADPGLPMQCNSCVKLDDGSCPFQGVEVKLAAAGGGNCPQYLSQQAQTDSRFGDDPDQEQPTSEAKLNERENMELEELKTRLEASEQETAQVKAEKAQLEQKVTDLQKSVELSEAHREESLARDRRLGNSTFTDQFVKTGQISPAQANIITNVLSVSQGDTVKLSDDSEATIETLLSEFIGSLEKQVPITTPENTTELSESGGRPGNSQGTVHEQNIHLAEERAKEIAATRGESSWRNCFGEAMREISAEKAAGVTNR